MVLELLTPDAVRGTLNPYMRPWMQKCRQRQKAESNS
jgi:hypothetical protein